LEDIRWFDEFGRDERMKGVVGLTPPTDIWKI